MGLLFCGQNRTDTLTAISIATRPYSNQTTQENCTSGKDYFANSMIQTFSSLSDEPYCNTAFFFL